MLLVSVSEIGVSAEDINTAIISHLHFDHAGGLTRLNDGHPGHVFNLGHGVMPAMDPDVLTEIVKVVHEEGTVRS